MGRITSDIYSAIKNNQHHFLTKLKTMSYKKIFFILLLLVSVNTFSQRPHTLHFTAKGGITQARLFNLDMSAVYKTKKNFTFSSGFDFYADHPKSGPAVYPYYNFVSTSAENYMAMYFNIGKVIPTKNPGLFFHLQTGPSYTALWDVGLFDDYGFSLSTKGRFPIGLHSSGSVVYQPFKFMQIEAGINSNISAVKSYGGIYLGIRFGGGRKQK